MIRCATRTLMTLAGAGLMAVAAQAHPGHDHTHASHSIVDVPAQSAVPWVPVGLITIALIVGGSRLLNARRDRSRSDRN